MDCVNKFIVSILSVFVLSSQLIAQNDQEDIALANQYLTNGDLAKARELFEDVIKKDQNIPLVHAKYFNLLLDLQAYPDADKYINRLIKRFPDNVYYRVDNVLLWERQADEEKTKNYLLTLQRLVAGNVYKSRLAAQYLLRNQLTKYAIEVYLTTRNITNDRELFALELANAYRLNNQKELMIQEYLSFALSNPNNVSYVKNVLQSVLKDESIQILEADLYEKIQKDPDNEIYADFLIWTKVQQKDFYGAFIQARAIDKRLKTEGDWTMEVGSIAFENQDYKTAIKIYDYAVKQFSKTRNYQLARAKMIKCREELVKISYPVDTNEILMLVKDYELFVEEIGYTANTLRSLRSKAQLHAFYLGELEKAKETLNLIINHSRSPRTLRAHCKLDLGDIYILTGEPWEAALLYSQVEKSEKETPIAYSAKLKNAKLHYFKGDFSLAKSHLDILKRATTREIANDAIDLSLLIQNNVGVDTIDVNMSRFSRVELLLFQNKTTVALDSLNELLAAIDGHSLTDEILYLRASIQLELGEFDSAIEDLNRINEEFAEDILADDSFYLIGKIQEDYIKDKEAAMATYQEFLSIFPGSLYIADVRKRFRSLRGDLIN